MINSVFIKRVVTWIVILIAILFGLATIKSGGQILFGSEEARIAAGNYIPFVLWFNFSSGFLYIIAGIGIALQRKWSIGVSLFILLSTLIVFVIFGFNIFFADIAYENRTVGAMFLRIIIWFIIFTFTYKQFKHVQKEQFNEK